MIMQSIGHATSDEGIALAMALCESTASSAFRLARFVAQREKTVKAKKSAAAEASPDPLLVDACSEYRGGAVIGSEGEARETMSNLVGAQAYEELSQKPFVFTGTDADLSYFWKRASHGTAVTLPISEVDAINPPDLREKTQSVLAKAKINGWIARSGDSFVLTKKSDLALHRADYTLRSIGTHCAYQGLAYDALRRESDVRTQGKIDRRLAQLGKTDDHRGCDRMTVNREKLLAKETKEGYRFYIP